MKRVLSALFCAVMLIASLQPCFLANAKDSALVHWGVSSYKSGKEVTNTTTSYENGEDEEENWNIADFSYIENLDEAKMLVRDALVDREESLRFYMPCTDVEIHDADVRSVYNEARTYSFSNSAKDGEYLYYNSLYSAVWGWREKEADGKAYVLLKYDFNYRSTAEQEEAVNAEIKRILPDLIGETDYETIKNIHDYICKTVTYDKDSEGKPLKEKSLAYSALFGERSVVCTGYCSLFYRLVREAGIDSRIVYCEPVNHNLNMVFIGGKWYYCDCTLGDDEESGEGVIDYSYFMKGKDFSSEDKTKDFVVSATQEPISNYDIAQSKYEFNSSCGGKHLFVDYGYENKPCSELYCKVERCEKCGETRRSFVKSSAHTRAAFAPIEYTCTESGISEFSYCGVCTEVFSKRHITDAAHRIVREITPASIGRDGVIKSHCERCSEEFADEKISAISEVKLSEVNYVYDGRVKAPSVITADSDGNAIPVSQYTVSRSGDMKLPGVYTVTVDFNGNYIGRATLSYTVRMPLVKVKKYTRGKKTIKLMLSKAAGVSGYQIRYSTNKNFRKRVKTVKLKGTVKKLKKLKSKKKYYIKVRAYVTVDGRNYYGDWSRVYKIKTK